MSDTVKAIFETLKSHSVGLQVDFGNMTVGVATMIIGLTSLVVALSSNDRDARRNIATLREEWIEKLRTRISEFAQTCHTAQNIVIDAMESEMTDERRKALSETNASIMGLEAYIALMLNTNEHYHIIALEIVRNCRGRVAAFSTEPNPILEKEINSLLVQLESISRVIFKTEWDRIKDEIIGRSQINIWLRNRYRTSRQRKSIEDATRVLSEITRGFSRI